MVKHRNCKATRPWSRDIAEKMHISKLRLWDWNEVGRPPDPHPTCRARKAVKNDLRRAQRTLEASLRSNLYNKLSAVNNRTDPIFYTMIKHQRQTKQTTGSSLRVDDQIISDTSETLEAWAAYFENLGTPANKPNFDADFHEFCLQENHILDITLSVHRTILMRHRRLNKLPRKRSLRPLL